MNSSLFFRIILFLSLFDSGEYTFAQTSLAGDTARLKELLNKAENCELQDILKYAEPGAQMTEAKLQLFKADQPFRNLYLKYLAGFYNNIGYYSSHSGNAPKAFEYYNKSLKIREQINDKSGVCHDLNNIALIYENQGDIMQALEFYHRSLTLSEEIRDTVGLCASLNNMGVIYQNQGERPKAFENYNRALAIYEFKKDSVSMATVLNNIAQIYQERGDFAKALELFRISLKIRENNRDKFSVANSCNNIADLLSHSGKLDMAAEFWKKALKLQKEINHKEGLSESYLHLGEIAFLQNRFGEALQLATAGFELAREIGYPKNISASANILRKIYTKQNRPAEALRMFEIYVMMRDSIINLENKRASLKKQLQYEYEKRAVTDSIEKKIAAVTIASQETQLQQGNTQKIILFSGLALVVAFSFFTFNRYKLTRNQKQIIESQKKLVENSLREKESLLREIHHRVKNNLQVISGILELQAYSTSNEDLKELAWEGQSRVKSIALIHQKLYQTENISSIPFQEYLDDLTKVISSAFKNKNELHVSIDAGNFHFDVDTAVPLGLIINELITNSFKHAFHDSQKGEISVKITQMEAHQFRLTLKDNGKGMPESFDLKRTTSLGLQLVEGLCQQLKGSFNYRNNNGAEFNIFFKDNIYLKT